LRWRQCRHTGQFIPVDEAARKQDESHGIIVRGNFDAFVSVVDGTVIDSHRALEQHNKRNGVVNASEFSQEFLANKRKERERFYEGKHSRQETFKRKQEIHEIITQAERNHGH